MQEEATRWNAPEEEEVQDEAPEGVVMWHHGKKDTWHGRQHMLLQ